MEIITIISITIIVNVIFGYIQTLNFKIKIKLLNNRIKDISNLYFPVLKLMESYFNSKGDFISSKKCKELIETISSSDEVLKNN